MQDNNTILKQEIKSGKIHIKEIPNPTEEIQLYAIEHVNQTDRYGFVIEHIKNPSKEVCEASLKQHPLSIMYMKRQDDKITTDIIKKHPFVISYIQNPTEDMYIEAFSKDSAAIKLLENPSLHVKQLAIKTNPYSITKINKAEESLWEIALNQNGDLIEYLYDQTEYLCDIAVKQTATSLKYINKPTNNQIMFGLRQMPRLIQIDSFFNRLNKENIQELIEDIYKYRPKYNNKTSNYIFKNILKQTV